MEIMEVDEPKTNTSASTTTADPIEGPSVTNDATSGTSQTATAVKSDLNTPWFVYVQPEYGYYLFIAVIHTCLQD